MAPNALHPCQIKPSQISLHDKGEKYGLSFQYLGHKGHKSSDVFAILASQEKKIQNSTIILEGNCNLHNWLVVPVRSTKDLPSWFPQFLVCNNHFPISTK